MGECQVNRYWDDGLWAQRWWMLLMKHKDLSKQKTAPCFARDRGVIIVMSRKFFGALSYGTVVIPL